MEETTFHFSEHLSFHRKPTKFRTWARSCARYSSKKLCAERVGSSIEWEHFNISGARELNNAMRMLLTSMKKIVPALKFRKFSLLPLRKTQGHPTVKRKLINKSTLFNEGDHGRVTWARKTRPRYPTAGLVVRFDVTDKRPGC